MLNNQTHILLLVLLGDGNVSTIFYQVNSLRLSETINLNREGLESHVGDIILKDPAE